MLGHIAEMVTDKISSSELTVETYISTDNMVSNRGGVQYASKLPTTAKVNAFLPGDVLFSNIRTYFKKVWLANCHGGASADVIIFRPLDKQKIDNYFLYYVLSSDAFIESTVTASKGTKMPRGDKYAMGQYKVQLPTILIQKKISAILSAYDDLIENNLRRIKILEEMAQNLYREWFVKFRFPGHEQVRMVDSPVGNIPEGWEVARIDDVAMVHRGRSYRSKNLLDEGGLPFINLKCIDRDGGFRRDGLKHYEGQYKDTQKVVAGDIVIALTDMTQERRIVARAGRVPKLDTDFGVISMDLVKIEPKEEVLLEYLYGYFRGSDFSDNLKQHANGANVLHLSPDRIKEYQFFIPSEDLRGRFTASSAILFQQIENLNLRNITLRQTRDLLLPKLISGELDVSELDIDIGEAA